VAPAWVPLDDPDVRAAAAKVDAACQNFTYKAYACALGETGDEIVARLGIRILVSVF
jgi:hypothetical protein